MTLSRKQLRYKLKCSKYVHYTFLPPYRPKSYYVTNERKNKVDEIIIKYKNKCRYMTKSKELYEAIEKVVPGINPKFLKT